MRFYVVGEPFDNEVKDKTWCCGLFKFKKAHTKSDLVRRLKTHAQQKLFDSLEHAYIHASEIHAKRPRTNLTTPIFIVELNMRPNSKEETIDITKSGRSVPIHFQTVPTKLVTDNLSGMEYYKSRLPDINFRYDR